MPIPERQYVAISRYAVLYDVHRKTVYKWIASGLLETIRVGRLVRVENRPPTVIKAGPRRQSG